MGYSFRLDIYRKAILTINYKYEEDLFRHLLLKCLTQDKNLAAILEEYAIKCQ